MKVSTPFNHRIPKDVRENLLWRKRAIDRATEDIEYAEMLHTACATDPLFFINGFGWTYDPRLEPFPKVPFILYPYQEEAIIEIISAFNSYDLLGEKSRDMGLSWLVTTAVGWAWNFKYDLSFLLGSRVEAYVDEPANPKSLMWKIDYIIDNLPVWLRPGGYDKNKHRRHLHIENPETRSVIDGESTTENFAVGDRRTAVVLDEFGAVEFGHRVLSATRDVTKSRLFISTPRGASGNAFYDVRCTDIKKIRMHWSSHPIKSRGLYTTDSDGNLKVIDPEGYPENYQPILDGKLRSLWYDNECKRAGSAREIAQELDIDYQGAGGQYFDANKVQEAIKKYARPPIVVGDLDYDRLTGEYTSFRENSEGKLRLWCLLTGDGKPSINLGHKIICSSDVSAGTGASNSCAVFWDEATGEKLAEYVNPYLRPEPFAVQVFAIMKWFGNPKAVWESGGPGRQYGSKLIELGYSNLYFRKQEEGISKKTTDIPGIAQTRETKTNIISTYRDAVEHGLCPNFSKESLEDTLEYIYGPDGNPIHAKAQNKDDPSGAKSNHGDRTMADAMAWKLMKEINTKPVEPEKPKTPYGCLAWRNEMRKQMQARKNNDGWKP